MDHVSQILEQWRKERPDLDVVPMGVLGRLKRLHDHISRGLEEVFVAHGLNAASFDVLATLRRSGAPYTLSPKDLLNNTMVTSGTMTNRIDRLEAAGLVTRGANPEDGRSTAVALTDQGFALIDRVIEEHVSNQHRLTSAVSEDGLAALDKALAGWLASFEKDA